MMIRGALDQRVVYDVSVQSTTPEPQTLALEGAALLVLGPRLSC
jgi:hypothetical protein